MPTEVEAKFRAEGPEPLVELAAATAIGDAALGDARVADEVDRYLDTADGRLGARRWACRLRTRDGLVRVSLKGPPEGGSGDWLHRRPEVEGPATADPDPASWPPSDARALVERLRGGAPLVERLRLEQRRTERPVRLGGRQLGTLSLDEVVVRTASREHGRLHMVELELSDAGPADAEALEALARELARRRGLAPDPRTKLEHALAVAGIR